jgi:hypothetical protein
VMKATIGVRTALDVADARNQNCHRNIIGTKTRREGSIEARRGRPPECISQSLSMIGMAVNVPSAPQNGSTTGAKIVRAAPGVAKRGQTFMIGVAANAPSAGKPATRVTTGARIVRGAPGVAKRRRVFMIGVAANAPSADKFAFF